MQDWTGNKKSVFTSLGASNHTDKERKIVLCCPFAQPYRDFETNKEHELEATRVTSMLLKYTALYNSHISVVIHENKANDFATGHIGSAVLKKAEIIMSVTKCKNIPDSSDVVCDYSRGYGFEPFVMTINEHGYPYVNTNKVVAVKEKAFYEENIEPPF